VPQSDLDAFLPTIRGLKILSVDALDKLYARWENRRSVAALYEPEEAQPTAQSFEDLSDEEVKLLMQNTLLARNKRR
jgi:hypothetical protein